ncbi:DoxX family membrane protein [Flavobacterium sp.]|jgi:uncharacterized membrane protein YphA (DoxX/SURF4 family)|uniref:DoxX family membrane protein n=1 Tax=Flavobacterium sp. TaxID=239 RepID=UPI0037840358
MKIATIIVRVLLGAMMLFASISYFFNLGEQPAPTGDMATLMGGLMASKYMFPLVKSIELIAGLMLVSGKFVKLGTLLLLPISMNIFLIHTVTQVSDLPVAIFVLVANVFLIYANWDGFKEIVKP